MSLGKKLFKAPPAEAAAGSGNTQDGLILHLDAADVDSYDNNGSTWYNIADFEYAPAENPEEHFNTVTYTGNASDLSITGVGFQPDLVWIKGRSYADHHMLYDSLRGPLKSLSSSLTNPQSTNHTDTLKTFDSDGFTLGADATIRVNKNNATHVAWCLKAGGAPTASTPFMIDGTGYATASAAGMGDDGDLTLQKASVNTKLGFAMYKFDPDLVSGETNTFQHGLGAAPELIITKSVSDTYNWWTWTKQVDGSWDYLRLNGTHAKTNDTYTSGGIATADDINFSYTFAGVSSDHIMYAFSSVRGVSKVGRYAGTGSAGNKVYTGFEPAFVMFKNTSAVGSWIIHDNKRDTDNPRVPHLRANTTGTEDSGSNEQVDFNRDGFTLKSGGQNANYSGHTYIYLAFAKNTNDESLIDDTPVFELDLSTSTPSDVTVVGATYDEALGNMFTFDGINDELRLTKDYTLNDRTIEFWIRPYDLANQWWVFDALPDRGFGSDSYGAWSIYMNASSIVFVGDYYDGNSYGGYYGSHGISNFEWAHIAFSCGGTSYAGYVNGELISEISSSSYDKSQSVRNGVNINDVRFMSHRENRSGDYYAQGAMGSIRIYDSILTQDQIRQNYNATKHDYSNNLHFTNAGSRANWLSEGSWNFDASANEYFTHTAGAFQGKTGYNPFAISAWVKPDEVTSSWRVIIGTRGYTDGSLNGWQLYANQDDIRFWGNNGSSYELVTLNSVLSAGTWVHVVIQRTNDVWEGYINGSLSTNSATNKTQHLTDDLGNIDSVDSDLIIGRNWQTNAYQWDGTISDIKIFNKALTAAEITAEYDKGKFGDK